MSSAEVFQFYLVLFAGFFASLVGIFIWYFIDRMNNK